MSGKRQEKTIERQRTAYLDYLRVFAFFAVVVIHVAALNWYGADVDGFAWQVFNVADSSVRWAVPVFVMISGALFLGKDIPIRALYTKYILRLACAFVVWSAIYVILLGPESKSGKFTAFVQGHYHMWFVLMIIGLYMCIPIIKSIANSSERTKYYLILAFLFASALPVLLALVADFGGGAAAKAAMALTGTIDKMQMQLVLGYTGYFLLGYWLSTMTVATGHRRVIYVVGVLGFLFTAAMTHIVSGNAQMPMDTYYEYPYANVLAMAVAVFVFFKQVEWDHDKMNAVAEKLSKYTFGAYLVHALVLEALCRVLVFAALTPAPPVLVCLLTLCVFVLSYGISAILHGVPFIKKYMV